MLAGVFLGIFQLTYPETWDPLLRKGGGLVGQFLLLPNQRGFISVYQDSLCCAVLSRFSRVWLFATLWTVAHHPWGFSWQGHWSGLLCPPPGDLPDPGMEPAAPKSPALAGGLFTSGATRKAQSSLYSRLKTFELCWIMWLLESLT